VETNAWHDPAEGERVMAARYHEEFADESVDDGTALRMEERDEPEYPGWLPMPGVVVRFDEDGAEEWVPLRMVWVESGGQWVHPPLGPLEDRAKG
jgi:hypothetical protein